MPLGDRCLALGQATFCGGGGVDYSNTVFIFSALGPDSYRAGPGEEKSVGICERCPFPTEELATGSVSGPLLVLSLGRACASSDLAGAGKPFQELSPGSPDLSPSGSFQANAKGPPHTHAAETWGGVAFGGDCRGLLAALSRPVSPSPSGPSGPSVTSWTLSCLLSPGSPVLPSESRGAAGGLGAGCGDSEDAGEEAGAHWAGRVARCPLPVPSWAVRGCDTGMGSWPFLT